MFALNPQLAADTHLLGELPLCRVLLMNDQQYPWLILVPRRADVSEVFELSEADQALLWQETRLVAEKLKDAFGADKINIATLGNVVSQLHMHVIARFTTDAAWPAPVWGRHAAKAYSAEQLAELKQKLSVLGDFFEVRDES